MAFLLMTSTLIQVNKGVAVAESAITLPTFDGCNRAQKALVEGSEYTVKGTTFIISGKAPFSAEGTKLQKVTCTESSSTQTE